MPPPPTPFTLLKKKRVKAIFDVLTVESSTGLCAVPADGSWVLESVKGLYYIKYQSFCPVVCIGSSTHSLPRKRVCPPQGPSGREAHSLAAEGVEGPNSDYWPETGILYGIIPLRLRYCPMRNEMSRKYRQSIGFPLKVHKIEIFFGFDFEICNISLLVMSKY